MYDEFYIPSVFTGGLLANKSSVSAPYKLGPDEYLEVRRVEIYPPLDGDGLPEDLDVVQLMVEGSSYDHIFLKGRADKCMAPPVDERSFRVATNLGTPMYQALNGRVPTAIEATCPKVGPAKTVGVRVVAGASAITADFEVDLLVAKYDSIEQLRAIIGTEYDAGYRLRDPERDKLLEVPKMIPVEPENWSKMPGGVKQEAPMVYPYIRYAHNKIPTTASTDYIFDFGLGTVAREEESLAWTFDANEAILIQQLGYVPHANSRYTWLKMNGKDRPEKPYETKYYKNKMPLGTQDQKQGPLSLKRKLLVWDMKADVRTMDTGTIIGADGVMTALWGKHMLLK